MMTASWSSPSWRAPRTATACGSTRSSPKQGSSRLGAPIKIVDEPVAEFVVAGSSGSTLYLQTDLNAERGRVVGVDLDQFSGTGPDEWPEVLAESADTLSMARLAGEGLIAVYLADAQPQVRRFGLDGPITASSPSTGGAVLGLNGEPGDPECFLGLSSVTSPTQSYRLQADSGDLTPLAGTGARRPLDLRRPGGSGGTQAGDQRRRHGGAVLLDQPDRGRPVPAPADPALGVRRVQDPDLRRLSGRLVRLARGRRAAGDRQSARRRRVRHRVVRRGAAGPQAERLRRFHRRRRAPGADRGDQHRPSLRSTAGATAGCWSAR